MGNIKLLLMYFVWIVAANIGCASLSGSESQEQDASVAMEHTESSVSKESPFAEVAPEFARTEEVSPEAAQTEEAWPQPDTLPDSSATDTTVVPERLQRSEFSGDGPVAESLPELPRDTSAIDVVNKDSSVPEHSVLPDQQAKICTFNTDCPASERCECDEQTGCFCKQGQRGTGKSGTDVCKTGNDCVSSLCNEGSDGLFYCSGPCNQNADCGPKLPICANISILGKVCIRKKP